VKRSESDLAYNTLAIVELHAHQYSAALHYVQLAIESYDQHGRSNPSRLSSYQHTLALARQDAGDSAGAAQAFQTALATMARANETVSIQRIVILQDYAALLRRMRRKGEARKMKQQAAKELVEVGKNNSFKYSVNVNSLLNSYH
jgi:hypothetical protein